MGLLQALKILGFAPYHLSVGYINHGVSHMRVFEEALIAQCNLFSGKLKYTKPDLDKWLGEYDVSTIQCLSL